MFKYIKKITAVVMIICMVLMVIPLSASAASKTTISFSSKSVKVGSNVTVTIKITSDHKIEWSQASIKYNSDILQLTSAAADDFSGGNGFIKMIPETGTRSFTFKALKAGNCTFEVYDVSISSDGDDYSANGTSATLNVTDPSTSSNEDTTSEITEVDDIVIDGKVYHIKDAPADLTIPIGFASTSAIYNSKTYKVYKNNTSGLTLFYLFCEENQTGSLFAYEPTVGQFTPLSFISTSAGSYIIKPADTEIEIPAGFSKTTRVISGNETEVYVNSGDAEFCLFFAEGPSGVSGLYVYDTVENTVQRYFGGFDSVSASADDKDNENLISKLLNNPSYRMMVICGIGAILVVLLVLIIVLSVKLKKENNEDDYDFEEDID